MKGRQQRRSARGQTKATAKRKQRDSTESAPEPLPQLEKDTFLYQLAQQFEKGSKLYLAVHTVAHFIEKRKASDSAEQLEAEQRVKRGRVIMVRAACNLTLFVLALAAASVACEVSRRWQLCSQHRKPSS